MTFRKLFVIGIMACMLTISIWMSFSPSKAEAFSSQVIQHGATGEDVIELQARLQHIGYYTGNIDGVFGWSTYWALRNFQYEFGMDIDGLAGKKTKEKLRRTTKYDKAEVQKQLNNQQQSQGSGGQNKKNTQGGNDTQASLEPTGSNVPQGYSQNDIKLLSNAVHGESRGESYEGQVAVAAVILNRVESSTFPNTVSGVVFEPRAFTAVADGQIWMEPNEKAERAVMDAINGWDPSGNALYYFNPDTATSDWIWSRPQIKKIGKHIFCK